jgi:hypothetical protein
MKGGKREGAGRKPGKVTDNIKMGINIKRENAEWLRKQPGMISHIIDDAIDRLRAENKLFLLVRIGYTGYDEYRSKLICATSEDEARIAANGSYCDDDNYGGEGRIWQNEELVSCQEIKPEMIKTPSVIIADFKAG